MPAGVDRRRYRAQPGIHRPATRPRTVRKLCPTADRPSRAIVRPIFSARRGRPPEPPLFSALLDDVSATRSRHLPQAFPPRVGVGGRSSPDGTVSQSPVGISRARPLRGTSGSLATLHRGLQCARYRDSVARVDDLECVVVEFDRSRQCVPGRVGEFDHRGRFAVGQQWRSVGRHDSDVVEVHSAESSEQRLARVVEGSADARVDSAGQWGIRSPPGGSPFGRLFRSPRSTMTGSGSALRVHLASIERRSSYSPGLTGRATCAPVWIAITADTLLAGIDRHFHVDVKGTQAQEGVEPIGTERVGHVIQVGDDVQVADNERKPCNEQLVPAQCEAIQTERAEACFRRSRDLLGRLRSDRFGCRCSKSP